MTRRFWFLGAVAALGLTVAACSSTANTESEQSAPQSSTATQSAAPAQSGDDSAPQSSGSSQEESEPVDPIDGDNWSLGPVNVEGEADPSRVLVFHDFRVAKHDGFTRVVVEFAGEGTSGYQVVYGENPVHQGKGDPIDVQGVAFLDVVLFDTTQPVDTPYDDQYYSGENSKTEGNVTVVQDGTFEANTHLAIGLDDAHEYQVGTLENPSRLVIDIKD